MDKILVATDGSKRAEKAVDYAIDLAKSCNAELNVVCVADTGSPKTAMEIDPDYLNEIEGDWVDKEAIQAEREKLEDQIVAHFSQVASDAGIKTSGTVRTGDPAEELVSQAKEGGADLIIMGTHGRGALAAAIMGSVATKVVHAGELPVLIVP